MIDSDNPDDLVLGTPIRDDLVLWRRVPPDKCTFDDNLGRLRPSTDAFSDHRDGSSMSIYDSEVCGGREVVMNGHDDFLLCSFTAGFARSIGLEIIRTVSGGAGHCEAVGKKTKGLQNKLTKEARWVIPPKPAQ